MAFKTLAEEILKHQDEFYVQLKYADSTSLSFKTKFMLKDKNHTPADLTLAYPFY